MVYKQRPLNRNNYVDNLLITKSLVDRGIPLKIAALMALSIPDNAEITNVSIVDKTAGALCELAGCTDPRHTAQHEADAAHEAKMQALHEQKMGRHFVGIVKCSACGTAQASCAFIQGIGPGEPTSTEMKPVCSNCESVFINIIGKDLGNLLRAPCGLCEPYPVKEGSAPGNWIMVCAGCKAKHDLLKSL